MADRYKQKENEPITRQEQLLDAISSGETANLEPITREEMFLAKLGGADVNTPTPITRKEQFLMKAVEAMSGGNAGGGFATGTYMAAEKVKAQSITIVHGLGVVPEKFFWFITSPEYPNGYSVPGEPPICFLYADNEKVIYTCGNAFGSSSQEYHVTGSVNISKLSQSENAVKACNEIWISNGWINAGDTITWFAFGG